MRARIAVFFVVVFALLLYAYLSVTEAFGIKCPAFNPLPDGPVIPDAPRPPAIGLSDKPLL